MEADLESFETCALREMYRNVCKREGRDSCRAGKMGRSELVAKLRGKRIDGVRTAAPYKEPVRRAKMSDKMEECFVLILDALRAYTRNAMLAAIGRKDSPEARAYLVEARKLCKEAVGCTIDQSGNGWEGANKAFNVVDRALLRLRTDFSDTLVSECVMASLLSEKHMAEMEAAGRR